MKNENLKPIKISDFIKEVADYYILYPDGRIFSEYYNKFLKILTNKKGYYYYTVKTKEHRDKKLFIHRVLMICYNYREDYNIMQVNHIDGNKKNNNLNNLEWCTNEENMQHAVKNNLIARQKGESNPANKLKEKEVLEIIEHLLKRDLSYSQLAAKYRCSKSTISAIKSKRNWTYLTKDIDF